MAPLVLVAAKARRMPRGGLEPFRSTVDQIGSTFDVVGDRHIHGPFLEAISNTVRTLCPEHERDRPKSEAQRAAAHNCEILVNLIVSGDLLANLQL